MPISADIGALTLAMVNPHDFETISELGFTLGKKVNPVIVPSFMMEAARKILLSEASEGLSGKLIKNMVEAAWEKLTKAPPLITLLQYLAKSKASDMLHVPNEYRINALPYQAYLSGWLVVLLPPKGDT